MLIIKKSDASTYKDDLTDTSLDGIQMQGTIVDNTKAPLQIMGMDGKDFIKDLPKNSHLIINLHLYSMTKMTNFVRAKIAHAIAQMPGTPNIILSSSQFFRETLRDIRYNTVQNNGWGNRYPSISIASPDEFDSTNFNNDPNDMVYSTAKRLETDYEVGRIVNYVNSGVSVMLEYDESCDAKQGIQEIQTMTKRNNTKSKGKILLLTRHPEILTTRLM